MKSYLLRLDDVEAEDAKLVRDHFRKKHGRDMAFATILRTLIREAADKIRGNDPSHPRL